MTDETEQMVNMMNHLDRTRGELEQERINVIALGKAIETLDRNSFKMTMGYAVSSDDLHAAVDIAKSMLINYRGRDELQS